MDKKKYLVLKPINYGGRIEKGQEIEMDQATAEAYGEDYVVLADSVVDEVVDEVEENVDIEKMSLADLKEEAKKRDLPTSGTKAELIERIKLAEQASEEDDSEDEE